MGTEYAQGFPRDGEGPIRPVLLSAFAIDVSPVTNADFHAFVAATGYRTEAEYFGWSFVFGHIYLRIVSRLWWKTLWRRRHGGAKVPGHFGVSLKGRERMWRSEWIIRSFMSHGEMLAHMLRGPLSSFRPRRSGSTLRAEGLSRDSIRGVTSCFLMGSIAATSGRGSSRWKIEGRTGLRELVQ